MPKKKKLMVMSWKSRVAGFIIFLGASIGCVYFVYNIYIGNIKATTATGLELATLFGILLIFFSLAMAVSFLRGKPLIGNNKDLDIK